MVKTLKYVLPKPSAFWPYKNYLINKINSNDVEQLFFCLLRTMTISFFLFDYLNMFDLLVLPIYLGFHGNIKLTTTS